MILESHSQPKFALRRRLWSAGSTGSTVLRAELTRGSSLEFLENLRHAYSFSFFIAFVLQPDPSIAFPFIFSSSFVASTLLTFVCQENSSFFPLAIQILQFWRAAALHCKMFFHYYCCIIRLEGYQALLVGSNGQQAEPLGWMTSILCFLLRSTGDFTLQGMWVSSIKGAFDEKVLLTHPSFQFYKVFHQFSSMMLRLEDNRLSAKGPD